MIVVDASALLEALLRTPAAAGVEERLFDLGDTLHAPHLIDIEVAQVRRCYAVAGQIEPGRCREALSDLSDFPLHRYPHDAPLPRVWEQGQYLLCYRAITKRVLDNRVTQVARATIASMLMVSCLHTITMQEAAAS